MPKTILDDLISLEGVEPHDVTSYHIEVFTFSAAMFLALFLNCFSTSTQYRHRVCRKPCSKYFKSVNIKMVKIIDIIGQFNFIQAVADPGFPVGGHKLPTRLRFIKFVFSVVTYFVFISFNILIFYFNKQNED